jgi:nucleotide-binding universal stress UspA family protein
MKSMLILTDFSENAFRAAEYACGLTVPLQINRIVLYSAYQTIIAGTEIPVTLDSQQLYLETMQELGLLRDRIKSLVDDSLTIDLIAEDTYLADRINPLCREQSIYIVAMGISGKSGLGKLLIGRTTVGIQRTSEFPLLIVPHEALIGSAVTTVVFTTDLKGFPAVQADWLREILGAFRADLHVINIKSEEEENHYIQNQDTLKGLHDLLNPYDPKFHFLQGEDVTKQILAFSELHHASMIIAVHRKRGFFSGLFHESVSEKLAYNSQIPLLSLPDLQ